MENNLFDLTGKIALVTGGAGLLGPEHAIALATHGAKVYLADINEEKCNEKVKSLENECITPIKLDVTDKENWQEVVSKIVSTEKSLDILVNNAGYTNSTKTSAFDKTFENFSLDDWNSIMNVNLTGTFLGCQAVANQMKKQKKGSIINMASLYGVVSPNHKMYPGTGIVQPVAYTVSKHGVVGLTKYAATWLAESGVRVNSITPGGIFDGHDGLFLERFKNLNPIGRMSNKNELRGAVVYLASEASSHVVGHNLVVDGGWTSW